MFKSLKLTTFNTTLFILVFSNCLESKADILDYFKRDLSKVPSREKLEAQEPIARKDLTKAIENENKGRERVAIGIHKNIVKKYTFTTAAAESQFKIGEYYMKLGKDKKAFEAFQDFVVKHKSSNSFMKAISNQYKIANGVLSEKKEKKLKVLPDKVRDSELLSWFNSIIESAPFSKYSPLAQFALAESYQNDKKISLAIASYQKLVDKYPNHKLSSEAQYRIGDIARKQINLGSRDSANITHAKNAMEDVIVAYENSPRAKEAKIALKQLNSIQGTQLYETGLFYEKQNQLRSAVIYYEKAAKTSNNAIRELATQRINVLSKLSTPVSTPKSNTTQTTKKKAKETSNKSKSSNKVDTTTPATEDGPLISPPPQDES